MAAAEGVAKFRLWVDASAKPTKVFVLHSIIVLPKAQDLSPCRLLDIGSMNVTIHRVKGSVNMVPDYISRLPVLLLPSPGCINKSSTSVGHYGDMHGCIYVIRGSYYATEWSVDIETADPSQCMPWGVIALYSAFFSARRS